ncbi:MAG: hypothetical protein LQ340_000544 [Diploschistes diacapsis]|nr:MAG: hypothetical protein LQ340_000544 [Diploschistes diacapsis]
MLDIEFSEPRQIWKAGDDVSGVVRISHTKPVYAQQITVSLKGLAKCRFGLPELNSLHSAESCLIERNIKLLQEPTTLREEVNSWPFNFVLPDTSDEHHSPFQEPSRLYTNEPIQLLPPTFTVAKKDTASSQDTCSITYGIYVSIDNGKSRSNLFKSGELEARKFINFQPDRIDAVPNWKMVTKGCDFEARTPLLDGAGDTKRSLSIKEKLLTTLKPSSLPSAAFRILMSIPKAVVVGQPIPLFISVQHKPAGSVQRHPLVEIKSLNVKLESLTGLRGHVENYHGTKYLPASHSSWTRVIELGKFNGSLPLEDITDLRLHLNLLVPQDSVQSFATFNIARAYTVKIQGAIECVKEKFKANFEIFPVALLASHASDAENPPGTGARPSLRPQGSDGSLPTWEESVGYSGLIPLAEKEELPPEYA